MVFGSGIERGCNSRRSDTYRSSVQYSKVRTPQYIPPESKMLEAHHLRLILNSQDDASLRKADNNLITSLTALHKTQPSREIKDHLSKIEVKQRIEDLNIMKPSKLRIPIELLPKDRKDLETKLQSLEDSGELMETHPASHLLEQAEEVVTTMTDSKKRRGRPKKLGVIYLSKPSGQPAPSIKIAYKKQLSKSILDNVKSVIETDSNNMLKSIDQKRLKSVETWLSTYFPHSKTEIEASSKRLLEQIEPIIVSHIPTGDSKATMERLKIPGIILESLNSIFSENEIHIPKALSRLRSIIIKP